MDDKGYIGVDLDGTLAEYTVWKGYTHIGNPIPLMVSRVKEWLREGKEVRIVTAREKISYPHIKAWCLSVFGVELPITDRKTFGMIALYDDRAESVVPNTGVTHRELFQKSLECLQRIREDVDEIWFEGDSYENFLDTVSYLEEFLS